MQNQKIALKGFKGYEIDTNGKIWSYKVKGSKDKLSKEGVILTDFISDRTYMLAVSLSKDGKSYEFDVHKLVAEAFCPKPEFKADVSQEAGKKLTPEFALSSKKEYYIHFKDKDIANVKAENLEWKDYKQKIEENEYKKSPKGLPEEDKYDPNYYLYNKYEVEYDKEGNILYPDFFWKHPIPEWKRKLNDRNFDQF